MQPIVETSAPIISKHRSTKLKANHQVAQLTNVCFKVELQPLAEAA